jgi:hypothetical protein
VIRQIVHSSYKIISHHPIFIYCRCRRWRQPDVSLVISRLTTIWSSPGLGRSGEQPPSFNK